MAKKRNKLEWWVYHRDFNEDKIEKFNVFQHWRFCNDLVKLRKDLKKDSTIDTKERIKKELMYYFWSKSEYEILISPWISRDKEKSTIKIDIYDQVMMNFEKFHDYVMENIKYIKEEK